MERVVMATLVNDDPDKIRQMKHDNIQLKEYNKILNKEINKMKNDSYQISIFSNSLKEKFFIITILFLAIYTLYLKYENYYNMNDYIIELKEEVKTYKAEIKSLSNQLEEFEINFETCKYDNDVLQNEIIDYEKDNKWSIDKELKQMQLYDNIKKSNDNTYLFFVIVSFIIVIYYKIQLINIEFKTNYQMMKSIKVN